MNKYRVKNILKRNIKTAILNKYKSEIFTGLYRSLGDAINKANEIAGEMIRDLGKYTDRQNRSGYEGKYASEYITKADVYEIDKILREFLIMAQSASFNDKRTLDQWNDDVVHYINLMREGTTYYHGIQAFYEILDQNRECDYLYETLLHFVHEIKYVIDKIRSVEKSG
jgi:hypothetical protein